MMPLKISNSLYLTKIRYRIIKWKIRGTIRQNDESLWSLLVMIIFAIIGCCLGIDKEFTARFFINGFFSGFLISFASYIVLECVIFCNLLNKYGRRVFNANKKINCSAYIVGIILSIAGFALYHLFNGISNNSFSLYLYLGIVILDVFGSMIDISWIGMVKNRTF